MSATIDVPMDLFADPDADSGQSTPISEDLIHEVENQLMRKCMEKFGGRLNMADAVALYANTVEGVQHIRSIRTNKDGSDNQSDVNFGNVYEGMEVFHANREGIASGTNNRAARTEDLYENQKNGQLEHDSLKDYAIHNGQHTDVIHYDQNGNVFRTEQMKHVRGTAILLEEKYTTDPDAPDAIIVPPDMYARHEKILKDIIQKARKPEIKRRAKIALAKLEKGAIDSVWTGKADKDSHPCMAWMIEKTGGSNGVVGKAMPYAHIAGQAAADAAVRTGERVKTAMIAEVSTLVVGGAIWELRDAWQNPSQLTWLDRVKRLFWLVVDKIKNSAMVRLGREVAFEAVNLALGALAGVCTSCATLLKTLGKSLRQVWDSIVDYFTGKITSFKDLVAIIAKTITAVGIGTLAFLVEQKLSMLGLPSIISGLLAAAMGGIAIVFANRGIDALIFTITSAFSQAKAAELRRERIQAFCEEMIPQLVADRENFTQLVKRYYAEREAILEKNVSSLREALATTNALQIYASLENINNVFGKSLGWSTQEEFDDLMLSDEAFKL